MAQCSVFGINEGDALMLFREMLVIRRDYKTQNFIEICN